MKKRIIHLLGAFFLLCLSAVLISCSGNQIKINDVTAADGEPANGFLWEHNYSEITITGYIGTSNDLVIPDRINGKPVTIISEKAFENFEKLNSVYIPGSVTEIGEDAFRGCTEFSVTIGKGATSICHHAFAYCDGLTSVTIPDSVTEIGEDAFAYSDGLTSVTIPDSVTKIGRETFYYCKGLTSVTIPDSVTEIGDRAFHGCEELAAVYYTGSASQWSLISIGELGNDPLLYAKIVYDYAG